eukprot:2115364-Pleurochrysis_carterae.AAC.1
MPTHARGSMRVFEKAWRGLTANARHPKGGNGATRRPGRAVQDVYSVGDGVGPVGHGCSACYKVGPRRFHNAADGSFGNSV